MTPKLFEFEGERLTVRQIRERVPVLPDVTIRAHLAAGRCTRAAMLAFNSAAALSRGGSMAAKRAAAQGHARVVLFGRRAPPSTR